jgi:hypothetical protein
MLKAGDPRDVVLAAVVALDKRCEHQLGETECRRKVDDWANRYARGESFSGGPRRAEVVTLADVQPREVEWLWPPYLPAGMLSMLSGDPGVGKTYAALAIAAALSIGRVPCSSETCAPIDVLYLSAENDPACVVRPRFDALGGDPARLHIVTGTVAGDGKGARHDAVWLTDIDALRDALDKTHARLLIVDPIQSYLGANVDAHRANETRPVLDGLARLAGEYSCAVHLARHLSKARGGRAIHAGLGSIDLTGAVRTELLAGYAAGDQQHKALVMVKSNLGAYGPALGYVIDERGIFAWTGESTLTATDILAPDSTERGSAVADAVEWLREYLADSERTAKEVERAARSAGFSWATIRRAKSDAGIQSRKAAFGDGWVWQRKSEDAQPAQQTAHTHLSVFEKTGQIPEDAHEDAPSVVLSTFVDTEDVREKGEL